MTTNIALIVLPIIIFCVWQAYRNHTSSWRR